MINSGDEKSMLDAINAPTKKGEGKAGGPPPVSDEPRQMPLMTGMSTGPEGLPVADIDLESTKPPSKLMSHGTLLIVAVAGIAAIAIWTMRVSTSDLSADKADANIEVKIAQALAELSKPKSMAKDNPLRSDNLSELFGDTDSVLQIFEHDVAERQVPLEYVKKNPFVAWEKPKENEPEVELAAKTQSQKEQEEKRKARERELKQRTFANEFKRLRLQTVVQGRRPIAVINGDMYQIGMSVGSFTINAIKGTSVELKAEDFTFMLTMDDGSSSSGNKRLFND